MKLHTLTALCLTAGVASAASILTPGDTIIAIAAIGSNSSYPGGENPDFTVNGDADKYLNFGGRGSGLIITPSGGASAVTSLAFTTANDDDARDPSRYTIYGTNDAITSAADSDGLSENWTEIHSTAVSLPTARNTAGTTSDFANSTSYTSYKLIFDDVRGTHENLMQIGEVGFFTAAGGTGTNVGPGSATVGVDYGSFSRYPGGEAPSNLLDGDVDTKYLNFATGGGSGFIVTPGAASIAKGFSISTANDAVGRDPASYSIYGTNDAIVSLDNSGGLDEAWTLIQAGSLSLTEDRKVDGDLIGLANSTSYDSYKIVFDSLKDNNGIMQISGFTLDTVPEPSTGLLSLLGAISLLSRRRR